MIESNDIGDESNIPIDKILENNERMTIHLH